jgi:hypothetical protein
MDRVHEMARRLGVHIVAVVQANRFGFKPKDIEDILRLKPTTESIKNAAAYGERSRVILGLFRKKYYAEKYFPEDSETKVMDDILEVQMLKQNQGKLSTLKYLYVGERFSFFKYEGNS